MPILVFLQNIRVSIPLQKVQNTQKSEKKLTKQGKTPVFQW